MKSLKQKVFFVNVNSEIGFKIPEKIKNKRIGLVSTSEYIEQLKKIKVKNSVFIGQVVGCNASNAVKFKDKVDVYFFLGNGRFHPIEIARRTGKEVYTASGEKFDKTFLEQDEKRKKGLLSKFFMADKVGILITTKPGQDMEKVALNLKEKIKNKEVYLLLDDTFNVDSLENFNDIDIFINTACPRIESKNIISWEDVWNALK
jgi:2-(3-amino-3-carboxypropyl)histidine synthase